MALVSGQGSLGDFFFFTVLFVPLLIVYFIVQLAMEAEIVAGE